MFEDELTDNQENTKYRSDVFDVNKIIDDIERQSGGDLEYYKGLDVPQEDVDVPADE